MSADDFEVFFADNYRPVVRSLAMAVGDGLVAEDLAQEAFARALRRWTAVRTMERPATWVYVVAIREFGRQRRRALRPAARGEPEGGSLDPWNAVDDRRDLIDLVATLPPRQRAAVVLRYHAGLSVAETADAMDCAVGTVKATLHAALQRLRVEVTGDVS